MYPAAGVSAVTSAKPVGGLGTRIKKHRAHVKHHCLSSAMVDHVHRGSPAEVEQCSGAEKWPEQKRKEGH